MSSHVKEEYGRVEKHKEPTSDKKIEKEKPNFGLSGKLAEETNTYKGIVIKYSEPVEARKPAKFRWRLYPFKGEEALPVMHIHRQSAYLLGRERKIADIPIDHPSCSKQHAVIQYRLMPYERNDGSKGRKIRPYIIDLESANGTFVNNTKIEPKRYVELFEKDILKFGFSSREYVILHEGSKDVEDEDETEEINPTPPPEQLKLQSSIKREKTEHESSSKKIKNEFDHEIQKIKKESEIKKEKTDKDKQKKRRRDHSPEKSRSKRKERR